MPQRFLIAVDYGTTFTGVSWVLTNGDDFTPKDLNLVRTWPSANNGTAMESKVPSLITYSPNKGTMWGYGIGEGAYVLRWTKLQLEPPTRDEALERLKHTLEETRLLAFDVNGGREPASIPYHLTCSTERIVTDYLHHVAEAVEKDIIEKQENGALALEECPIDLIITHPAAWHARARNITFRAVNEAFRRVFPKMRDGHGIVRMTTEPEACGQHIMHSAARIGLAGLRKGQCFVVVDAGGGTVDLVSYQVDQPPPDFRITRITEPSSGNIGSALVDQYFLKRFLQERLSDKDYDDLVNGDRRAGRHGSGPHSMVTSKQHELLERFQTTKHGFSGDLDVKHSLQLPGSLGRDDNPRRGSVRGQVQITGKDLANMFEGSVSGIKALLLQQLAQVQLKGLRAQSVFLSGGFSKSPYLGKLIENLCDLHGIALRRAWGSVDHANTEWTAQSELYREAGWADVALGAAMVGLGIGCPAPLECFECPFHIGIVVAVDFKSYEHSDNQAFIGMFDRRRLARDHVEWLAAKGDLIAPSEGIDKTIRIARKMALEARLTGSVNIVISKHGGQGQTPTMQLNYDLEALGERDRAPLLRRVSGMNYHVIDFTLNMMLDHEAARFELTCGGAIGQERNAPPGHRLAYTEILWADFS